KLDWAHLRLVGGLFDFVTRADRPGEVVDVVAVIGNGLRSIRVINVADFDPAGTDDFVLWHCEFHVVDAEVGEELRSRVVLVAIPSAVPKHSDFREPLPTQQEVTLPS